ncbi:mannose-1-phosphate guanylyltransferase [Bifidobacterium animalis subsp. animalis MCC 1489]|uniref:Mannose-1-phosphate guanylyltransferase (GDP) n=1 Tax=Bifidobacterium animalis subsp. animalis IM386 TaxID=1402194 RepID=A0AAV2W0I1_9BIFI|nr:mannose-1-phosphate guanylyltransferase [Bifidobacterium animalis]AFI62526.1 mannose-1-phosphate guanylyltransferase (GDP) [Bifidobacterium animalis subsp. animalis ATCC 25527]AYN23161.1 mannose-1-phosphate guanylyltransferase (GDP) [Bifidobacterium animalis subsp. animalis]KFI39449.1 mannose-1-phosphate guanylyltransferase (GDP) [Bifidobacterium animalis subsp. animalis]KOA62845.1 mannose-1-phosphate guanylyltransferase [Bifidobacterium animalis subsp. animalis MCC 1489]CDI66989.1 Mannose-
MSNGFDDFYAIIPAGGTGTRLWPLSREAKPKFLFDLLGSGRTLIQSTFDRLAAIAGMDHVCVSTGERHVAAVEEQLPEVVPERIFAEPAPRDSTAAIALATAVLARRHGNDIVVGSFAADHVIRGKVAFVDAVRQAVATARAGYVTTIGIAASRPSTAFGYIHEGESLAARVPDAPDAVLVERFVEKPNAATAQAYLNTGEYRWNAGMFVMRADVLLDHLHRVKPQLARAIDAIADAVIEDDRDLARAQAEAHERGENVREAVNPDDFHTHRDEAMRKYWQGIEKIAFDYAVAEPLSVEGGVAMIPGDFGWDDIGDFNSVAALLPSVDERNLKILGNTEQVVTLDSAGDIVVPNSERTVALLGVNDMVVVDTPDALLIAPRARSQEVKSMVKTLAESGCDELL